MNKYMMPVAVVLAGLFIGGAVIWSNSNPSTTGTDKMTNKEWLAKVTKSVDGISFSKVEAAVQANTAAYAAMLTADRTEGQKVGVSATPSFLIGTQLIAGAYPYEDFKKVIDAVLEGTVDKTAGGGTIVAYKSNEIKTEGSPFIGDAAAPLTIGYWSDYQCPFCKKVEVEALPQIIQDYVDTGKVKIVFKDFAFLGPASQMDGEYARAVWELYPKKFFAWRTQIMLQQPQENSLAI